MRPPRPPRTGFLSSSAENGVATTTAPHAPGVVVLGTGDPFDRELAAAFADAGVHASAGGGPNVLRALGVGTVYVLGRGDRAATALAHAADGATAGVIVLAGDPPASPPDGALVAPVLALYGAVDGAAVERIHSALEEGGTLQEVVVYDEAPAAFFDASRPELARICDDAWRRMLRFLGTPVF